MIKILLRQPRAPMRASAAKAAIMILASSFLLGGCGGGAKYSSAQDGAVSGYYAVETAAETTAAAMNSYSEAPMAAPIRYDSGYIEENGIYDDYEAKLSADIPGGLTDSSSITRTASLERKLIRNVFMSVETDHFDDILRQLQAKVTELSGYIEQSDVSGERSGYSNRYANMTARIPSTELDRFISVVEESGNVTYKSESTQDVTLQYSDLESRKKTLTMEQDRIWALLEKADTLESVIALEERLSEIRYELESMESQLKLYDNQVAYSTIEIRIDEMIPSDFTPTAPETVGQRITKGFTRNVSNMADFFTDLFIGFIVFAPVWIPFGLILLAAVVIIRVLSGRRKHHPAAPAKPAALDSATPNLSEGTESSSDSEKQS